MQLEIRDARAEDAADALVVLRRSIAELCVADHRNDPKILESWLGNKTTGNFVGWVKQPDNSVLVAQTARRFYLSSGYAETGQPGGAFGTSSGYPMSKDLI
jgi:hypothetical protein